MKKRDEEERGSSTTEGESARGRKEEERGFGNKGIKEHTRRNGKRAAEEVEEHMESKYR